MDLVGAVERSADLAAEERAEQRAGGGRGELALALADLRAEQAASAGPGERADGLLAAIVGVGAAGQQQATASAAASSGWAFIAVSSSA